MPENQSKNIGKIQEHTKVKVTFNLGFELTSEIYSMEPSCGCSTPKIQNDKVVVKFNSQSVPVHLRHQGYYTKTANVKIRYNNGKTQMIYITAKVVI